jgi:hypothetical protein
MKPVTANLKHLYQCRKVMIQLIALALMALIWHTTAPSKDLFPWPIVIVFFGLYTGQLVSDVWNKPFAFCIPRYDKSSHRVMIIVGSVITLAASLIQVISFKLTTAPAIILFLGLAGLNNLVY